MPTLRKNLLPLQNSPKETNRHFDIQLSYFPSSAFLPQCLTVPPRPFLRELDKTAADKLPVHADGIKERGRLDHPYKITPTGKLIDDALEAVAKENPKLKNVLNKNYTQLRIDPANLAGLINLIATIPFLLTNQFAKSVSLERAIKANLRGLGYAL